MRFLVSCAPGLEPMVEEEIRDLGIEARGDPGAGVIAYDLEWSEAFEIMLRSRLASRVLLSLRVFSAKNEAMLYDQVRRIDWSPFLQTARTMAVFSHGRTEAFALTFAALKIKDAVCDEYRKHATDRPSVDRQTPDMRLEAFFGGGRCELSLDLCGEPLHRRGYRDDSGEAPLRENRAAALLRFAGFGGPDAPRSTGPALIDPFCGSGTIAIEAALMLQNCSPGTLRPARQYAVVNLFPNHAPSFEKRWSALRSQRTMKAPRPAPIVATDLDRSALRQAKDNARRAGVQDWIDIGEHDARDLKTPNALIVSNPPYGLRLEDEERAIELVSEFTRQIKHHCAPATLALVLPEGPLSNAVGFKPDRKLKVKTGDLTLQFAKYSIRAGKFGPRSE